MLVHPEFYRVLQKNKKKKELTPQKKYYLKYLNFLDKHNFFKKETMKDDSNEFNSEKVKELFYNVPQICFEVTEECNLSCKYCCYGKLYKKRNQKKQKKLNIADAIALLNYLFEGENFQLNYRKGENIFISFYGGEPLLNFKFISDIVKYSKRLARKYKLNFSYSMTTNGVLLNKYMEFLFENKFEILISLDGDEKSSSYRIFHNGKLAFPIIYKNSILLKDKYPEYFRKKVNFSVVKHNLNSYIEIVDYFKKEFDRDDVMVSSLDKRSLNEKYRTDFEQIVDRERIDVTKYEEIYGTDKNHPYLSGTRNIVKSFSNNYYKKINQIILDDFDNPNTVKNGVCLPFQLRVFITARGKIYTCEKVGGSGDSRYILGTINGGVVEIDFDKISIFYNDFFSKLFKLCRACENYQSCIKCPLLMENSDPEIITCDDFVSKKKFLDNLSKFITFMENQEKTYDLFPEEVIKNA